jgi:hypothetical protein
MTYCADIDLIQYRPNILQLGVDDWTAQRQEAFDQINRVLSARWFRKVAPEMGLILSDASFDPDKVKSGFLRRLECFKTLELAYMFLKKDSPEEDGFERNEKSFRQRYNEELEIILATGVEYDWDDSGEVDASEKYIYATRRNVRS